MFGSLLIALSLVGDAPPAGRIPEDLKTYAEARAALGRGDASAQVRLALWCEAHGLRAEKLRHLALAVVKDPKNATARGLLGLVAYRGRWQSLDAVVVASGQDAAETKALAEYNARRSSLKNTADAHWKLALWCESQGLKAEALAHFTGVTRLDPRRDAAWKRLGCRRVNGRWMTDAQVEAERNEVEAVREASRRWKPLLMRLRFAIESPEKPRREAAEAELSEISDPEAVPAVMAVFGEGPSDRQFVGIRILGQIESGGSTRGLAMFAVFAHGNQLRKQAMEMLKRRDPSDYLELLIGLLKDPIKFEVQPLVGLTQPGVVTVEGKKAFHRTIYSLPRLEAEAAATIPARRYFTDDVPYAPFSGQNLFSAWGGYNYTPGFTLSSGDVAAIAHNPASVGSVVKGAASHAQPTQADALLAYGYMIAAQQDLYIGQMEMMRDYRAAEATAYGAAQMAEQVASLKAESEKVQSSNVDVLKVLTNVTDRSLGEDPEPWRQWWIEQQGYAYRQPLSAQFKPVVDEAREVIPPSFDHSCFAAGTLIPGPSGARRIEELRLGDQVLTQDTQTGLLSCEPVLAVFHNKPAATLRLRFDEAEEVVATPIHRFWRAGKGWAMARDLKPGDLVRTINGTARFESASNDSTQPVFNLEVAGHRSFFVGKAGMLVHDNSLVETVASPFDAPPPLVAKAKAP